LNIHLSTATIKAYENRQKMMNLHFCPIVMLEGSESFTLADLKNIKWTISAIEIGTHTFDIEISVNSPFETQSDKNYVEFKLKKMNVPFRYDDYECQITFSAVLNSLHESPIKIEHTAWGVVKTIWSIGIQ
jgi:hypothetical protein